MTTIIIDDSSKEGKALVEFLLKTKYAEIVPKKPNAVTRAALIEMKQGKAVKCKDAEDMFNKLRS